MAVGALFLSLNVAPTEEILLISYQMTPFHAFALASMSILLMHAFVYSVGFSGESSIPEAVARWSVFLRYTLVGYAICLVISAYILWTFGRTDGLGLEELVTSVVVLAFPASIGAAAARLIL
jgi:putative integral membrane protein (TIGR02587 family)